MRYGWLGRAMDSFAFFVLSLVVLALLGAALYLLLFAKSGSAQRSVIVPALPSIDRAMRYAAVKPVTPDHEARSLLEKNGVHPDSTIPCVIQTSDGDQADFLQGILASYHSTEILRVVIQIDEQGDPRGYWRSWDIPWSKIVEIVLRQRTTPQVHTNTLQPNGTYGREGKYAQARLYEVGKGIACRFLDREPREMEEGKPYRWLQKYVLDTAVRFSSDTQEDSLYGDRARGGDDSMDGYALHAKARDEREQDERASAHAMGLTPAQIQTLMASRPAAVRERIAAPKFAKELEDSFANAESNHGHIALAHKQYVRKVIDLTYAGTIPRRFAGVIFYSHFKSTGAQASESAKGNLFRIIRLMAQELSYLERE